MINCPRFFIHLYFYRTTFDFKTVAFPYNPTYIKKIKSIKGCRWNPEQKYWVFSHSEEILSKGRPRKIADDDSRSVILTDIRSWHIYIMLDDAYLTPEFVMSISLLRRFKLLGTLPKGLKFAKLKQL